MFFVPASRDETAETLNAGNEKAAESKDAKTKGKTKNTGKGKDNTAATKGKAGKGEGEERHDW